MAESMANPFPLLFSPWRIGSLEIPNRIILSPMTTGFGYRDGAPEASLVNYFRARTNDVGMAVVAFAAVSPEGRVERQIPWMWRDDAAEVLKPLFGAIAAGGAVPCLQLGHGGRQVSPRVIGTDPVAPSAVTPDVHVRTPPRELTASDIKDLISAFADAAIKAAAAGFKVIEVHAAHGYLIHQFLAAASNRRDDRYGGSTIMDRTRFGAEVISAIKASAPELAVLVRINGSDLVPGGLDVTDAVAVAGAFTDAGADALVVSSGVYGSVPYTIPLLDDPEGTFLDLAAKVRSEVDIPVVGVGRITRPATAEHALALGQCDAVAVGRALLADPEWATKASMGNVANIRPCIGTVEGCAGMLQHGDPISCSVNPDVGREEIAVALPTTSSSSSSSIVVVGAGPAGLEAARSAAIAGHNVTVIESATKLGGNLNLAAQTPPLAHLALLVDWFERELHRLGVELRLEAEADLTFIHALDPDHVVIATGAVTDIPVLDGYDELPVWTLESLLAGEQSTIGTTDLPRKMAILGNGRRSLAATLWLADRGCETVTVADGRAGQDTSGLARRAYLQRIEAANGRIDLATPRRLVADGLLVSSSNGEAIIACDGIVIANPVRTRRPSWTEALDIPTTIIGDAREPRGIGPAISEGRDIVHAFA
jgi:2,4-dienoyl-CoA reductase-like NADH-dependent reductase (Old Yellow Enzyme family)